MRTAPQCRDSAAGGHRALWDQRAGVATKPGDHAVDQRVVGRAVDLGDRDPILDRGEHGDLPIGDMAGEDDHAPPGRDGPVDILEAVGLDAPARFVDPDFSQVRVFVGHTAEIVPHAARDIRDLTLGQRGKSAFDIAPGPPRDTENRADQPPDSAAHGGSVIDRQQAEGAKQ